MLCKDQRKPVATAAYRLTNLSELGFGEIVRIDGTLVYGYVCNLCRKIGYYTSTTL